MYSFNQADLTEVVKKVSVATKLSPASIYNMLNYEDDNEVSNYLGVVPASINQVLNGEANNEFAKLFGLTESDLDNLILAYGKSVIIGLVIGIMIKK